MRHASTGSVEPATQKREHYLSRAGAAMITAVVVAVVTAWISFLLLRPALAPVRVINEVPAPAAVPVPKVADPRQEFSRSLTRLSDAVEAFSPISAEEVLRAVAAESSDCSFQWNEGQPALLFGGGKSISTSLDRCAEAVEHFRPVHAGR